jgi:hypothetical protein
MLREREEEKKLFSTLRNRMMINEMNLIKDMMRVMEKFT